MGMKKQDQEKLGQLQGTMDRIARELGAIAADAGTRGAALLDLETRLHKVEDLYAKLSRAVVQLERGLVELRGPK